MTQMKSFISPFVLQTASSPAPFVLDERKSAQNCQHKIPSIDMVAGTILYYGLPHYNHMSFQRTILLFYVLSLTSCQSALQRSNRTSTCNIISVSGASTVLGTPDMALASISVSSSANTSSAALNQLNTKTRQLLQIFNQFSIPLVNIQTTALSLYPQYNYSSGQQALVAQKAGQIFSLKITNISNGSLIGSLVDAITALNGIVVTRLVFDISNKTDILRIASTNAWNDAYNKAYQYANLSSATLGRAFAIRIPNQPSYVTQVYNDLVTSSNEISVGNFGVSANVEVDFLINS